LVHLTENRVKTAEKDDVKMMAGVVATESILSDHTCVVNRLVLRIANNQSSGSFTIRSTIIRSRKQSHYASLKGRLYNGSVTSVRAVTRLMCSPIFLSSC